MTIVVFVDFLHTVFLVNSPMVDIFTWFNGTQFFGRIFPMKKILSSVALGLLAVTVKPYDYPTILSFE